MSTLTERLRAEGLVVVAVAVGLAGTVSEIAESARPTPPAAGAYAIAVLAGVLLCWRRRAPVAVGAGIVALCLLYHLIGYPGLAPATAMFVAVGSLTAAGTGARSLAVAGALIVALSIVPLLPPHQGAIDWPVIGPATALVAVAAFGEATRARRVALTEQLRVVQRTAEEDARLRLVEERLVIAREVHDVLAHTITIITVQAATAVDALDDRPEETRAALGAVRGAAREAMAELRTTLVLLRGEGADPLPPQPGFGRLPSLVEQARAAGLAVTSTITGAPAGLSPAVELAVYRIVQEALTNTIRHSGSTVATIDIHVGSDVVVEVTDPGPATDQDRPQAAGHGLVGMRERARAVGGTVEAGPVGVGFRVAARIPAGGSR